MRGFLLVVGELSLVSFQLIVLLFVPVAVLLLTVPSRICFTRDPKLRSSLSDVEIAVYGATVDKRFSMR